MSALRVARGFTGRDTHHQDRRRLPRPRRRAAGQGRLGRRRRWACRARPACRRRAVADTLVVPFNDLDAMRAAFEENRERDRRASSSSRSPATWACVLPRPATCRCCARSATSTARCSSSTRSSPASASARGGAQQLLRRAARPDLPRQDRRRRPAPRRLRRPRRRHGRRRAASAPSTRRARCRGTRWPSRPGSPRSSASTSTPTSTLEGLGRVLEDDLARAVRRTGRQGARPARRLGVHALLHARGGGRPGQRQEVRHRAQYAKFFHGMLERGFLLPPAQFEAALRLAGPHARGRATPSRRRPRSAGQCWQVGTSGPRRNGSPA